MEKSKGVMGAGRRWAIDFSDNSTSPSSRDIADPPGFTPASDDSAVSHQKKDAESNWKAQEEKVDSSLEFLILASDGLWDVVSNEEAVEMVKPIKDPELAAKRLMQEACERGSADNITCRPFLG